MRSMVEGGLRLEERLRRATQVILARCIEGGRLVVECRPEAREEGART